jgi:hypothetical protein
MPDHTHFLLRRTQDKNADGTTSHSRPLFLFALSLVALCLATSLANAASEEDSAIPSSMPAFSVDVEQSQGGLHYVFYDISHRTVPPKRVPVKIMRLIVFERLGDVNGAEITLWRIVCPPYSEVATDRISYGVLPPGWTQEIPAVGPPASLQSGKSYFIYAQDEDAMVAKRFTHLGP